MRVSPNLFLKSRCASFSTQYMVLSVTLCLTSPRLRCVQPRYTGRSYEDTFITFCSMFRLFAKELPAPKRGIVIFLQLGWYHFFLHPRLVHWGFFRRLSRNPCASHFMCPCNKKQCFRYARTRSLHVVHIVRVLLHDSWESYIVFYFSGSCFDFPRLLIAF